MNLAKIYKKICFPIRLLVLQIGEFKQRFIILDLSFARGFARDKQIRVTLKNSNMIRKTRGAIYYKKNVIVFFPWQQYFFSG